MALPLIPIITALASGGSLVPHAAGGLIVTGANGFVAGTYISTAALTSFITGVGAITFASLASVLTTIKGAVITLIGGAGLFGTTIGATGITGFLRSIGILPSVPIIVPVFIGIFIACLACFGLYATYNFQKLYKKLQSAEEGVEMNFSESEAMLVEKIIRSVASKSTWLRRLILRIFFRKKDKDVWHTKKN